MCVCKSIKIYERVLCISALIEIGKSLWRGKKGGVKENGGCQQVASSINSSIFRSLLALVAFQLKNKKW